MDVVHHARYFELFERARTEMMRAAGASYRNLEESGVMLPLIEATAQYRLPVRYDEEVVVAAWVAHFSRAEVRFAYSVFNRDGKVAVEGHTRHPITTRDFRLLRLDGDAWEEVRRILSIYAEPPEGPL